MRKKVLFVALIWIIVAITILILYLLRETSPVKEIIAWALNMWVILAAIVMFGIAATTWIIKHDFGQNTKQLVEELLTVGIFTDVPVNITRILYHDREKLAVGLSNEVASGQDKLVLSQLNLRKIVKLEQRKVKVYGSDNTRDEGYWVLTELGKEVIAYLQKNQQALHKEGSLANEP